MKRILTGLLAGLLLLSGCSATEQLPQKDQLGAYSNTGEEELQTVPARHYISMIYYEDMDTNPLTTTNSENHELLKLVYSPLVRLNGKLEAKYVLAEQVENKGTQVRVVLKKGLKFSDGSAVTARDVAASVNTIRRTPTSPYHKRLANVKTYGVVDELTLSITLKEPDVDFVNCLDIPIMQQNGKLGCGPYQFSLSGGEQVLVPNSNYFVQPGIAMIYLKKPANEAQRKNLFSVGLLDVYFATAESDLEFSGGKSYQVQTYGGDNLLYLGVNCREGLLADAKLRGFLNQLISREKLVENVLLDQAEATAYPFQPAWYKAKDLEQEKKWKDTPQKRKAAAKLGLTLTEKELLDQEGNQLTFPLLVAEGSEVHRDVARAVAESFALSGVKIQIESVPRADYNARLQAGEYTLYLGEMKTGRTLNTTLFGTDSALNHSGVLFEKLEAAAAGYRTGEKSLTEFAKVFDRYTPILPLAYRRGVLFVASDIGAFQSTGTWALYGDITKLITKETELKK